MVGGFDVGSRIMADVFGGVGYRFTDSISTTVGYRWMKVDRDEGGFLYDVEQQGIIAGLTFTF
jgi:opacity protein-like surface antigen